MPLAQPLPDLRRQLQEILAEDLAAALNALKELLPEGSEKHRTVLELRARFNEANKQNFRGVISPEQLQLIYNQIRSAVFDLLESLEEGDFEVAVKEGGAASAKATAAKHGSVLYRVPHRMPLRKPTICTVRVALDEEAILEDIVLDAEVRLRPRVEVSDMMKAELLDPEGDVFAIRPLSEAEQLVRDTGYTQWLFSVTPRVEGEHQLLVKVSMMEFNEKIGKYVPREVSILETVTIVTETAVADSDETPLKSTGDRFTLGPDASRGIGEEPPAAVVPSAPALNIPRPSTIYTPPQPSTVGRPSSVPRGLRTVAFFLAFLLVGSTATWAFTPPPTRDWWVVRLKDSAEAYAGYIEKYKDTDATQHLEKAYFRKADKTDALADLREYQREFPQGQFREQVTEKVVMLEIKTLNDIRQQPDAGKILRFAQDFPESERLPALRDVVTDRADLLPALEKAYVASIRAQASPRKVEAFLNDFPKSERLPEVAQVLEAEPEVRRQVQPKLDSIIVRKVENAASAAEVKAILPVLESAGSSESAKKVEQVVAQKPQLKKQVLPQVQQAVRRVQQREEINRQRTAEEAAEKARLEELRRRARDEKDAAQRARLEKEAAEEAERQRLKKEKRKRIEAEARRDTDGDGVPDKDDKCPNEKGDAANNGCPPPKSRKSGLEMVPVKGGTFTMGCQNGRDKDC
ncbi:MAG: hypothetical protein EPGJADBJ_00616 [Saprospiraceae bacterium]|nr:hypothetical protein [Saprospiraceae bacterium]